MVFNQMGVVYGEIMRMELAAQQNAADLTGFRERQRGRFQKLMDNKDSPDLTMLMEGLILETLEDGQQLQRKASLNMFKAFTTSDADGRLIMAPPLAPPEPIGWLLDPQETINGGGTITRRKRHRNSSTTPGKNGGGSAKDHDA